MAITKHKDAAVRNMKEVDDLVMGGNEDDAAKAALLAASVLMHCLLYLGDCIRDNGRRRQS